MSELSTLPQVIDIDHYAGDTLTVHIKISDEIIAGREFTAQVRASKAAQRVDATFEVILTEEGADIVLMSDDSRALTRRGNYTGYWDVQLAMPDHSDPVTTLAYGELRLHLDVTRPVT